MTSAPTKLCLVLFTTMFAAVPASALGNPGMRRGDGRGLETAAEAETKIPESDLVLVIRISSTEVSLGDGFTLRAELRNTGKAPQTICTPGLDINDATSDAFRPVDPDYENPAFLRRLQFPAAKPKEDELVVLPPGGYYGIECHDSFAAFRAGKHAYLAMYHDYRLPFGDPTPSPMTGRVWVDVVFDKKAKDRMIDIWWKHSVDGTTMWRATSALIENRVDWVTGTYLRRLESAGDEDDRIEAAQVLYSNMVKEAIPSLLRALENDKSEEVKMVVAYGFRFFTRKDLGLPANTDDFRSSLHTEKVKLWAQDYIKEHPEIEKAAEKLREATPPNANTAEDKTGH